MSRLACRREVRAHMAGLPRRSSALTPHRSVNPSELWVLIHHRHHLGRALGHQDEHAVARLHPSPGLALGSAPLSSPPLPRSARLAVGKGRLLTPMVASSGCLAQPPMPLVTMLANMGSSRDLPIVKAETSGVLSAKRVSGVIVLSDAA